MCLQPGHLVWKTKDSALESKLRATYDGLSAADSRKLCVDVSVSGSVDKPLMIRLKDSDGNVAGKAVLSHTQSVPRSFYVQPNLLSTLSQLQSNSIIFGKLEIQILTTRSCCCRG